MQGRPDPVAEGTFDGRRFQVSNASTAKATASLASDGIPNSSDKRSSNPRSRTSLASPAINVGFFAPPPETMSSEKLPLGKTNLSMASRIERAVRAVAVAITSRLSVADLLPLPPNLNPAPHPFAFFKGWGLPQARRNSSANSRPNSSRPAVFGGLCPKKFLPKNP